MKKALFILLSLISALSLAAQELNPLANTVYKFGDKKAVTAKNTTSECSLQHILFNADSTFYSTTRCNRIETLASGRYVLNKETLVLSFANTVVLKSFDTGLGHNIYTDTLVKPSTLTVKAFTKKKQLQFKDSQNLLIPSGENYDNQLAGITEDNRIVRLDRATKSNITVFEGTDFSAKYDSIIIQRGLDKLNGEMALDYFDEENKISGSINGGYYEGNVHYSPDGLFKIFVFTGDSCGAHCSNIFESYVQFASGKVSDDVGFADILSLEKYDKDTYISIDSSWSGGTIGGNTLSLSLFSIENNSLTFHPLIYAAEAEPALQRFVDYQQPQFSIFSPWWASDLGKIEYDSALHKVNYSYMDSGSDPESLAKYIPEDKLHFKSDEGLLVTGEFTIENGELTDFKEVYKIQKVPSGE
ncbi:hypothetical protein AAEO56_08450 [Flavobacterium sp. DGU11]|uniref:Uncharacterized protein n=1 Tax=Flavobacterium arundinis TaxID=3139143 RepID=A0ABU9HWL0_9FLAO